MTINNKNKNLYNDYTTTWRLIKAYWHSEQKKSAWAYLIVLTFFSVFLVCIGLVFAFWYKNFWNAIQAYDTPLVIKLLALFTAMATINIVSAVFNFYLTSIFTLRWRRWLTYALLDRWMQPQRYYYLENFDDNTSDNPDQRIQEDINLFTTNTMTLLFGGIGAITTLFAFSALLWQLSPVVTIPLGSLGSFKLHGYLFWIAFFYSLGGTYLTHKIGRPLIRLNFLQQKREANFRFRAVRVRNNAENIALYQAETTERRALGENFKQVFRITLDLINRQKLLLYFTAGFNQISIIIPIIAALPLFLAKRIGLGGIHQIIYTFGQVQGAFSFIVSAYNIIAQWRAAAQRLTGFAERLEKARRLGEQSRALTIDKHSRTTIEGKNLSIGTQDGKQLFKHLDIRFEQGKHCLLTGPSGTGKTTLIRTLSGIWPYAAGTVLRPANAKIMYIPQRVYLPLGTLRDVILYPGNDKIDTASITQLLAELGLEHLATQLDLEKNWSESLSIGEQQRIAFARIILQKPDWVFLDESTSSLDHDNEEKMYRMLKEKLPHCTMISIAHRHSVKIHHDVEVNLAAIA